MNDMNKYIIYLSLVILFSCKKESKINQAANGNANAETYYSTPPFYQSAVTDVAASWNGEIMVLKNNSKFYYSKDGGNTFSQVNPNIRNYIPFLVNESGIMAWSDNFYSGFYNLNTGQAINSGIAGNYNEFYVGNNDWMYCVQGTNSSTPPIVYFKKLAAQNWDTLTKNGDSLGVFCGQNSNGGISFFNASSKTLFNHQPSNNSLTKHVFNTFSISNITQGQSNRAVKYFFNGFNLLVAGYTKGFATMNTNDLSVAYTDWQGSFKGYYENPLSLSCSKNGTVYAQLLSYVDQATKYEINNGNFRTVQATCDVINNGDFTYYLNALNPFKTNGNNTTPIKIGDAKSATLHYYCPYNGGHLSLVDIDGLNTILIDDKNNNYNIKYLNGNYTFIYKDLNKTIINSKDSLLYSEDGGSTFVSFKSDFHAPLTYLKKINNTYYALAVKNFKYNLGGTGFSVDKFNIGIYTSSNLKDWTLLPNTLKTDVNGRGPEIFSSNGLMTYNENTEPLGNPVYRGYKSTDFGASWSSSGLVSLFNVDLENSLSFVSYNGANLIARQNYNLNLDKTDAIQYQTTVSTPIANQIPIAFNGQVLHVSGEKVLILK